VKIGRALIDHLIAPVFVAGVLMACAAPRGAAQAGGREKSTIVGTRTIEQVLAAHTDSLMALPGVVGTAIAQCDEGGGRCIKVLLADSAVATRSRIPPRLEGYRVVVEVTGSIRSRGSG